MRPVQPCSCTSDHRGESGRKCHPGHTAACPVPPPRWYRAPRSTSGSSADSSVFQLSAEPAWPGSAAGQRCTQIVRSFSLFFFFSSTQHARKLCEIASLLPAPASAWHLIMFTECTKVGQRFTLYSASLLVHISTSLLTGEPHHGGSWNERKRGTSASSQMSLAVTVPLITGSQTECGEAGHLAYCTRDSRQQWVMMQTTQLSLSLISKLCIHAACIASIRVLLHVSKCIHFEFSQQSNECFSAQVKISNWPGYCAFNKPSRAANNPLLPPCVTEQVWERTRDLDMFPC